LVRLAVELDQALERDAQGRVGFDGLAKRLEAQLPGEAPPAAVGVHAPLVVLRHGEVPCQKFSKVSAQVHLPHKVTLKD
jgi:hypothetical protein